MVPTLNNFIADGVKAYGLQHTLDSFSSCQEVEEWRMPMLKIATFYLAVNLKEYRPVTWVQLHCVYSDLGILTYNQISSRCHIKAIIFKT